MRSTVRRHGYLRFGRFVRVCVCLSQQSARCSPTAVQRLSVVWCSLVKVHTGHASRELYATQKLGSIRSR